MRALRSSGLILSALGGLLVAFPCLAQEEEPSAEPLVLQVNRAITLAVRKVLSEQEASGLWGSWDEVHPTGRTALALLALLHAGLPPSHPDVERGLEALVGRLRALRTTPGGEPPYRSTYETGTTLLLLYALGPREEWVREMRPLVDHLARTFDRAEKLWGYPEGHRDLSNTQFALLGLRAASLRGVRPKQARRLWSEALEGVLRCHKASGGFAYRPERLPSASMTVAGLAIVEMAEEELRGYGPAARTLREARKAAEAARSWLERNFAVDANVDGRSRSRFNLLYYLWGLERYATIAGVERIAGRDWYRDGAGFLVRLQGDDGGYERLEDTCFALLFLRRAAITMPAEGAALLRDARREDNPRLGAPPREPEAGAPKVKRWLVLGPFAFEREEDDGLEEAGPAPQRLRPRKGRRQAGRRWTEVETEDEFTYLDRIGAAPPASVAYAAAAIRSEGERDAILWVDADDGVRLWLGGRLLFEHHHHDLERHLKVPVRLPAGRTPLLVKIENLDYFCRLAVRVTDEDGRAIGGVSFERADAER